MAAAKQGASLIFLRAVGGSEKQEARDLFDATATAAGGDSPIWVNLNVEASSLLPPEVEVHVAQDGSKEGKEGKEDNALSDYVLKWACNTLTTGAMVLKGAVYRNKLVICRLMIDYFLLWKALSIAINSSL